MDSLGYFGKWFPTEHKKYTAIIAMMYVGVVTTVLGALFELALRGLEMIGLFGGPAGIRRTMDVLTFFQRPQYAGHAGSSGHHDLPAL